MIAALCVSIALAASALAVPSVATAPALHLIGRNFGFSLDDRYAVLTSNGPAIRVRDTRTGRTRIYRSACQPGGRPETFHRHLLLLICPATPPARFEILDVATGAMRLVPDPHPEDGFDAVGRVWVAGASELPPTYTGPTVYVNWHTGERRVMPGISALAPPRDLDRADLPLRKTRSQFGDPPPLERHGYVVARAGDRSRTLLLRHRGKTLVLSRCRSGCDWIQFAPGLVVWAEQTSVRAYLIADRQRLRWSHLGRFYPPAVGATAYEVIIQDVQADPFRNPQAPSRVYAARWRPAHWPSPIE